MTASGLKPSSVIGFLSVREFSELGLIGGYLILNAAGRPLEFHCTAPVRPNRAQEILYGPTLAPYLYGEQIGQTLIGKGKSKPLFVCTDVEPAVSVRNFVSTPVLLLADATSSSDQRGGTRLQHFQLAAWQGAVLASKQQDQEAILASYQQHADELDLLEPFVRLREAIDEAQRGAARSNAA